MLSAQLEQMTDLSLTILPETADDALPIERLHERTFGPGRYAKSAYRLRGPLAVEPAFRERGVGYALIERALAQAKANGHRLVFLVGDEPYYGKSGFKVIPKGRATMPGPVDSARLLVCELADGALDGVSGPIRPDWSAA